MEVVISAIKLYIPDSDLTSFCMREHIAVATDPLSSLSFL